MYYSLRGVLIHLESGMAVVECGGVGYRCLTSMNTLAKLPPVGKEAMLYTQLVVRDGSLDLFGFADQGELNCFKLLTTVNKVGPKAALSILSVHTPDRLSLAVVGGDIKSLTQAAGVGPKLAQRIVLELKDKLKVDELDFSNGPGSAPVLMTQNPAATEAVSALLVLGYSQSEAASAIAKCDAAMTVEEMIRTALKNLASR